MYYFCNLALLKRSKRLGQENKTEQLREKQMKHIIQCSQLIKSHVYKVKPIGYKHPKFLLNCLSRLYCHIKMGMGETKILLDPID
jgi:hypothetical protein